MAFVLSFRKDETEEKLAVVIKKLLFGLEMILQILWFATLFVVQGFNKVQKKNIKNKQGTYLFTMGKFQ